jgi:hypothetical protein
MNDYAKKIAQRLGRASVALLNFQEHGLLLHAARRPRFGVLGAGAGSRCAIGNLRFYKVLARLHGAKFSAAQAGCHQTCLGLESTPSVDFTIAHQRQRSGFAFAR